MKRATESADYYVTIEDKQWYAELGKLDKIVLVADDHGWYNIMGDVDFGGIHQGFTFIIDRPSKKHNRRIGCATGAEFIIQLMKLFKVHDFTDLKYKMVYALYEEKRGYIRGLMSPLDKRYILFEEFENEMKEFEWVEKEEDQ